MAVQRVKRGRPPPEARGRGRIPGGGSLASCLRDQVERCGRGVTRLRELDVNLASRVLELTGAARDSAVEALLPRLNTLDGDVAPPEQRCGEGDLHVDPPARHEGEDRVSVH